MLRRSLLDPTTCLATTVADCEQSLQTGGGVIRGLVLAGGKSSRFGSNKAIARYQGVSLIERAVSLLNELSLKTIVATRKGMEYPSLECVQINDKLPDKGPLGGLYTAMTIFKNTSFLVLTCDMPALTPAVLARLLKEHEPSCLVSAYRASDGTVQPFPAIYESSLLGVIRENLKEGNLSMQCLLDRAPSKKLLAWNGSRHIFTNINSAEALRALLEAPSPEDQPTEH